MKTYLSLILLSLLLFACNNDPERNIDTTQNAYKEGYIAVEKKFDNVYNKLTQIKDFNDFKVGTVDLDSLSTEDSQNLLKDLRAEEIPLTLKFNNSEALVVHDDLMGVFKSDKSTKKLSLNMGISPRDNYSFLSTQSSQFSDLLNRKVNGNWDFKDNDSITIKEKNMIIYDLKQKVKYLDGVKYLILIDDIFIKQSKQKSDTEFYTGTIIMQVKFIDISTKEVLARKVFNIENTESISVGLEAGERHINSVILLNLMAEKIKSLNNFFGYEPL